MAGKNMADH